MENQSLIQEINKKELELSNLKDEYNQNIVIQKEKILNSKSTGMNKSLYLLGFEFESSTTRTSQYLEFHKIFKKEITALLKPYIKEIEISKPNHFDLSGFFKLKDDRIFYINLSDLRWSKDELLIRTAKDLKDYSGGSNGFITLNENFAENLLKFLGVYNEN